MFQSPNEFKYTAATGKNYIIYLLKSWRAEDYLVKYQIRAEGKDFFWHGRMTEERALSDMGIDKKKKKTISREDLANMIREHLETLFVSVIKKGLDKGFEEPGIEFVFCGEPFVTKRIWKE